MYHSHFGLEKGLFGDGIATDTAVFRSPKHDQIIANFKLALASPSSAVVLRGPAGVGKTTLASTALRASSTQLAIAWINAAPTNAAELLELVLVELGVVTARTTRIERIQLWRQTQAEMRATESRLFLVVERTEDLPADILHALDSLTAPDAAGNLGANLVLLGHLGVNEHLATPGLESLRQRVRLRAELEPFTEAELQDYLRHQVACAGGHFDHVFAPGTIAALFRHSGGVARLSNTLCATALQVAANDKQKLLTAELVTRTAVTLLGLGEPARAETVAAPSAKLDVVYAAAVPAAAPPATPLAPVIHTLAPRAPAAAVAASQAAAQPSVALHAAAPAPSVPSFAAAPAVAAPTPPAPPASVAAVPAAPVAPPMPAARTAATEPHDAPASPFEFDGSATDIADVALADFPVLTDAVEALAPAVEAPAPAAKTPAPPQPKLEPSPAAAPKTALAPRAAAPAPTPPPAAKPPSPSRIETAYTPKSAPAPKPTPAAATKPAAPATPPPVKAPAPPAAAVLPPVDPEDDDLLRQTQTMRAIAVAKSIDDISSSMAETLFGDGEMDTVQAALASAAAAWNDAEQTGSAPAAAKPAPAKAPGPPPAPAPVDDPFDLFGLGDDAPLELIDDATLPPVDKARKTVSR